MVFYIQPLPQHLLCRIIDKTESNSFGKLRRSCRFFHNFIASNNDVLRNFIEVQQLSLETSHVEETDWRLAIFLTQHSSIRSSPRTFWFARNNKKPDDLRRLQINVIHLSTFKRIPAWLPTFIQTFQGRGIQCKEFKTFMTEKSLDILSELIRVIKIAEVTIGSSTLSDPYRGDLLLNPALMTVKSITLYNYSEILNLQYIHPALRCLQLSGYRFSDNADLKSFLSNCSVTMTNTELAIIHVYNYYLDQEDLKRIYGESSFQIEQASNGKYMLVAIVVREDYANVYVRAAEEGQLEELVTIKEKIARDYENNQISHDSFPTAF